MHLPGKYKFCKSFNQFCEELSDIDGIKTIMDCDHKPAISVEFVYNNTKKTGLLKGDEIIELPDCLNLGLKFNFDRIDSILILISLIISFILISFFIYLKNKCLKDKNNFQPNNIQPNNIQPNNIQPNNIQPNNIQPNNIQPNNIQPNNIQPNNIQHNNIQPNNIQPSYIQPNNIQPSYIQPNNIQPNNIQPQPYVQPNTLQSSSCVQDFSNHYDTPYDTSRQTWPVLPSAPYLTTYQIKCNCQKEGQACSKGPCKCFLANKACNRECHKNSIIKCYNPYK
jgi:hypothetical protein